MAGGGSAAAGDHARSASERIGRWLRVRRVLFVLAVMAGTLGLTGCTGSPNLEPPDVVSAESTLRDFLDAWKSKSELDLGPPNKPTLRIFDYEYQQSIPLLDYAIQPDAQNYENSWNFRVEMTLDVPGRGPTRQLVIYTIAGKSPMALFREG